jgi:RimJ/RimL family protein N-acetyltransferase
MVFLREISFSDMEIINRWRNDAELVSSLVSPFRYINEETDRIWFENYMKTRSVNVRCAICIDDNPEIIGFTGLLNIDSINRKADYYIQIGEKKNYGKGIGFEATKQILNHAFLNLNLNRVQLDVLETNKRAISLYKKIGFDKEGVQRQAVYKNGNYFNLILMAIMKHDFTPMLHKKDRKNLTKCYVR